MRHLSLRRQMQLHVVLLCLPFAVLPLHLPAWPPPASGNPVSWLLLTLAVSVGMPFFVISSTSPLLQHWFSTTSHRHAADPYFLYRASNAGSMVALVGYPTVVEPHLTLVQQTRAWTAGFAGVAVLLVLSGAAIWMLTAAARRDDGAETDGTGRRDRTDDATDGGIPWRRRLRWVIVAAVPSIWMLALTSYMTTGLAPVPLLWVIPLVLYLLSFTIVFAPRPRIGGPAVRRVLPFFLIPLVGTLQLHASGPLWFLGPLHIATFFLAALICHGELAADRPAVRHLTAFYLWLAVGGVAGGMFAAVIAPVVFTSFAEYPVAIVLLCLLVPMRPGSAQGGLRRGDVLLPAGIVVLVVLAGAGLARAGGTPEVVAHALIFLPAALLAFAALPRRLRFGLAMGALLLAGDIPVGAHEAGLFAGRDFFGVARVTESESGAQHVLYSGTTVHGAQNAGLADRDDPRTYYTRSGPAGDLFAALEPTDATAQVSIIGLGAGSMACYARPGQRWTFYEIDPLVIRIARDPSLFTFLRDCAGGAAPVVPGDGRLSMASVAPHSQRLIVVDAFGSDVIPVHLLTREAIDLYRSKLTSDGVLAFNISNLYADLEPVLAREAENAGMSGYLRRDTTLSPSEAASMKFASTWLAMWSRDGAAGDLADRPGWIRAVAPAGMALWSDDFSNIFGVLHWS
jgi:hypothetical protein